MVTELAEPVFLNPAAPRNAITSAKPLSRKLFTSLSPFAGGTIKRRPRHTFFPIIRLISTPPLNLGYAWLNGLPFVINSVAVQDIPNPSTL